MPAQKSLFVAFHDSLNVISDFRQDLGFRTHRFSRNSFDSGILLVLTGKLVREASAGL